MTWTTSLPVVGRDKDGRRVPVLIGIWECEDGSEHVGLQRDEDGEPVLFDTEAENESDNEIQLSLKVRQMIAERMKRAGES